VFFFFFFNQRFDLQVVSTQNGKIILLISITN